MGRGGSVHHYNYSHESLLYPSRWFWPVLNWTSVHMNCVSFLFQRYLTSRHQSMMSSVGIRLCVRVDSVELRQPDPVDSHDGEKDLMALEKLWQNKKTINIDEFRMPWLPWVTHRKVWYKMAVWTATRAGWPSKRPFCTILLYASPRVTKACETRLSELTRSMKTVTHGLDEGPVDLWKKGFHFRFPRPK